MRGCFFDFYVNYGIDIEETHTIFKGLHNRREYKVITYSQTVTVLPSIDTELSQ